MASDGQKSLTIYTIFGVWTVCGAFFNQVQSVNSVCSRTEKIIMNEVIYVLENRLSRGKLLGDLRNWMWNCAYVYGILCLKINAIKRNSEHGYELYVC